MSQSVDLQRPRPVRDLKSGVDATISQARPNQSLLAERIRESWTETLEHVVETGNRLIDGRFRKADYERHALPFSYSWGQKLIKIARSPRILNPLNRGVLPDKADALLQIALLTDRLFELGVTEGVIHNRSLVIDITSFRQSFSEPGQSRRRRMTVVYECTPERDESARETLDLFAAAVGRLADARFPTIFVRGPRKMKELVLA